MVTQTAFRVVLSRNIEGEMGPCMRDCSTACRVMQRKCGDFCRYAKTPALHRLHVACSFSLRCGCSCENSGFERSTGRAVESKRALPCAIVCESVSRCVVLRLNSFPGRRGNEKETHVCNQKTLCLREAAVARFEDHSLG